MGAEFAGVSGAEHQADAGDAVGDVERQILGVLNVHVHVPESGDEESVVGIEDAACRWGGGIGRLDGENAIALENDGAVREFVSGADVDYGDVVDREGFERGSLR